MKNKILVSAIFTLSLLNVFSQATPTRGMKVKWITGLTYGVSSYATCVDSMFDEMVVDTGLAAYTSTSGPDPGIYSDNGYFVYTLPSAGDYTVSQHIITYYSSGTSSGLYLWTKGIENDSIPTTPTDCHATFYMMPDTGNVNGWVVYNFSTSSSTSPTYLWDFGDGTTSTLMNPMHTYSTLGNYNICLTISDGVCSDTFCDSAFYNAGVSGSGVLSLRAVQVSVGIKEEKNTANFMFSPNPASEYLNVLFDDNEAKENYVTVFDIMGRQLLEQKKINDENVQLNISELNSGIYILVVSNENGTFSKRFVKK